MSGRRRGSFRPGASEPETRLYVGGILPLILCRFVRRAWSTGVVWRAAPLLCSALLLAWIASAASAQTGACAVTLPPGQDIGAAVRDASRDELICLAPGDYDAFEAGPRVADGVEVRGLGAARIVAAEGPAVTIVGAGRFTLSGLTIVGGDPAGVRVSGSAGLVLRGIQVADAATAVLIDDSRGVAVENVTLTDASEAGLVVRRSSVEATNTTIRDATYGVAVLDGGVLLLRDSAIDGGAGAAVLVGAPGCADLPVGTADVPPCFFEEPLAGEPAAITIVRVSLGPGPGAGIQVLPRATAHIADSQVMGRGRGGLLVWGAEATVVDSRFGANGVAGIEYRSFPAGGAGEPARGSVERAVVIETAALDSWWGGDGVIVRSSRVALRDNRVTGNAGAGVTIEDWQAFGGELSGNVVAENDGPGLCLDGEVADFGGSEFRDNERVRAGCDRGTGEG